MWQCLALHTFQPTTPHTTDPIDSSAGAIDLTIRECVDEFTTDGLATVFRERQPLDDGQLRRIVDRSITRSVTRRDAPPADSAAPSAPILTVDATPSSPTQPLVYGPPTFADSMT
ncbi:MAG: hypothetical protein VXV91_02550, partial [Verrucomicrobiota bacterium]|nr:hypothetical protein [Verrucomicrobiota bacterium]